MNSTFRLGRVLGVRVGVNWSVLIIAWLLAWSLATTTLPEEAPNRAEVSYWIVGTITAIVFLASILAHEVGHAYTARRNQVEVLDITLWMFGGVARFAGPARTASAELRIALAGPAVSVAIVILAIAAAVLTDALAVDHLVVVAIAWLALINTALVLFNLLPAAPLDGGRVLSSILWTRWSDERRAHEAATRVGRGFGAGLVVVGLVLFAAGDLVGGVWLAFLGWFLMSAAEAEQVGAAARAALEGVRAVDVMTRNPVVAASEVRLDRFIDGFVQRWRHAAFPVVDERGHVVGLVTLRAVRGVPRERWHFYSVIDIATPRDRLTTATVDTPITDVISMLNTDGDRRVLVFDGDRLAGIISPSDIARTMETAALYHPEVTR